MKMVARDSWLWRRSVALGLGLSALLAAVRMRPLLPKAGTPTDTGPGTRDPDASDDARAWQDTVPDGEWTSR